MVVTVVVVVVEVVVVVVEVVVEVVVVVVVVQVIVSGAGGCVSAGYSSGAIFSKRSPMPVSSPTVERQSP